MGTGTLFARVMRSGILGASLLGAAAPGLCRKRPDAQRYRCSPDTVRRPRPYEFSGKAGRSARVRSHLQGDFLRGHLGVQRERRYHHFCGYTVRVALRFLSPLWVISGNGVAPEFMSVLPPTADISSARVARPLSANNGNPAGDDCRLIRLPTMRAVRLEHPAHCRPLAPAADIRSQPSGARMLWNVGISLGWAKAASTLATVDLRG